MSSHLLIFGFGYTARFLAKKANEHGFQVTATTRQYDTLRGTREGDCQLIPFSDNRVEEALTSASHLLISTPPTQDSGDPVISRFTSLLKQHIHTIQWIGYLSSTSVYGDHEGRWVDESTEPNAPGKQGQLRLAAENAWAAFATHYQLPLHIFRLAGIYGPGRNALARLSAGKQETIVKEGHCFSRIHVDDIVLTILAAMQQTTPGTTIYNVADDEPCPSHIVDEYAASLLQHPPLKQIGYDSVDLSPMAQEFYSHHKRVSNAKLKKELHLQLTHPTYKDGLQHLLREGY